MSEEGSGHAEVAGFVGQEREAAGAGGSFRPESVALIECYGAGVVQLNVKTAARAVGRDGIFAYLSEQERADAFAAVVWLDRQV